MEQRRITSVRGSGDGFLTTHYMEEAAAAGHIAIIDKGKLCEFGTPQELKMRYAKDTLTLYYKQEKHTLTSDNEKYMIQYR